MAPGPGPGAAAVSTPIAERTPVPAAAPEAATHGGGRRTYLTYVALGAVMGGLPEPVVDVAAAGVGLTLTAFRAEASAMYGRHLERVLGGAVDERSRRAWTRRAFRAYARYWVEAARLPSVPGSVIDARMHMEAGLEHLAEAMDSGRGVVVALPHVGSWEWGGAWLARRGWPMTAVAERLEPPELFERFVAQRADMGITVVPLDAEAGPALLRTLRAGGLVGLLCDRDILGNGVPVDFFGERTTLPAGPATLALRTGAQLLPAAVYSGPGRDHTGLVLPAVPAERRGRLRDDVGRVTQDLAHALERLIRRAPEQWHLFQANWPSDRTGAGGSRSDEAAA